jgi:hypothetical protein
MKRFTILFFLVAALALLVTPVIAGKAGEKKKLTPVASIQPSAMQRVDEEESNPMWLRQLEAQREEIEAAKYRQEPKRLSGVAGLSGLKQIGVGKDYEKLSAAVADLNSVGLDGDLIFEFTDAAYTDTGVTIGSYTGNGSFTVTFRPATGVSTVITFSGGSSGNLWGVRLNGANNVIWDGRDPVSGTGRNITLAVDTTAGQQNRSVVRVLGGTDNYTFRNLVMLGRRASNIASPADIVVHSSTGANNSVNYSYIDNELKRGGGAFNIAAGGSGANPRDVNVTIEGNVLGGGSSTNILDHLNLSGIFISYLENVTIHDNLVDGVRSNSTPAGIYLFTGVVNADVRNNRISNIQIISGGGTLRGIAVRNERTWRSTAVFSNNAVYNLKHLAGGSVWSMIFFTTNPGGVTVYAYYNTFNPNTGSESGSTYGLNGNFFGLGGQPGDGSYADSAYFYNNIFQVSRLSGSNYPVGVFGTNANPDCFPNANTVLVMDHNVLYSGTGLVGFAPIPSEAGCVNAYLYSDIQTWRDSTGMELNGKFGENVFAADGYHISQAVGDLSAADSAAMPIVSKTTDIDGEVRDATYPDAGADEFVNTPVTNDGGPVVITAPTELGIPSNAPADGAVTVKNYGIVPIDIPVRLVVTAPDLTEIYNQVVTAEGVPANSTASVTFEAIPFGAAGDYTLTATTEVPGDERPFNDGPISRTQIVVVSFDGTKYSNDFESNVDGWVGTGDFELGTFTELGGPHSGTKAWKTKIGGRYGNAKHSQIGSPFFDLTNNPSPQVSFWTSIRTEPSWDAAIFEYTTDGGATWVQAGTLNDPDGTNWYNTNVYANAAGDVDCFDNANASNVLPPFPVGPKWTSNGDCHGADTATGPFGWYYHSLSLPQLAGLPAVRFRYRTMQDAATADSGWAFDDFEIKGLTGITGTVFYDNNSNGTQDVGESGIAGVTVSVTGDLSTSTVTDESGNYVIPVQPGNYTVQSFGPGTNTAPGGAGTIDVVVVQDSTTTANFGWYYPAVVKGGYVWYDQNGNQTEDGGEPKQPGVVINVGGATDTTDENGAWQVIVNNPGTYNVTVASEAYAMSFPKTAYSVTVANGDTVTVGNIGVTGAAYLKAFRTATMNDWATAVDAKGKPKAIKCKPDKVTFKFQLTAPGDATGLTVKIGMVSSGSVTDASKSTTYTTWTDAKEVTYTGSISEGQVIQIEGTGSKGKYVKPSYKWETSPKATKGKVTAFIEHLLRYPMPNLNNVGEELGSWPTIGNSSGASSVIHPKYKDVQKSLNSKGMLHTGDPGCLDVFANSKPISKQQKSLPALKHDNKLFAEALTLGLNLKASETEKFPSGLGALVWQGGGIAEGMTIDEIFAAVNSYLGCDTVAQNDTTGSIANEWYNVLVAIDTAFAGALDTVSWNCTMLEMTGVKTVKEVSYLRANPGTIPARVGPKPFTGSYAPARYALQQNYPNPFNPTTTIQFDLVDDALVTLKVYNMLGQEIATLINNELYEYGENEIEFDASGLPSGVYFYRLTVQPIADEDGVAQPAITQVKKMLLLK